MFSFKHDDVFTILTENAAQNILPYFQHLKDDEIREKGPGNLVTDADEASEIFLSTALQALLQDSMVVGEEAVAKDVNVLNAFQSDKPIWIIDPIDGTYNFAHGRSKWGVFVSLAYKGEVVFGTMYDVLNKEFIFAYKGEGAHHLSAEGDTNRRYLTRPEGALESYKGHVGGGQPWHFKALNDLCAGITNVRCSLHDCWAFVDGEIDFIVHKSSTPWDHSSPSLVIKEAGGVFYVGNRKDTFTPDMMGRGYILATYTEQDWDTLAARFFPALAR